LKPELPAIAVGCHRQLQRLTFDLVKEYSNEDGRPDYGGNSRLGKHLSVNPGAKSIVTNLWDLSHNLSYEYEIIATIYPNVYKVGRPLGTKAVRLTGLDLKTISDNSGDFGQ
jgi:hypothetical protein